MPSFPQSLSENPFRATVDARLKHSGMTYFIRLAHMEKRELKRVVVGRKAVLVEFFRKNVSHHSFFTFSAHNAHAQRESHAFAQERHDASQCTGGEVEIKISRMQTNAEA